MNTKSFVRRPLSLVLGLALSASGGAALAQEAATPEPAQQAATPEMEELLSETELQTLVAPVALYPDTLLIQILVGATAPLDVVKAERLLARSEGVDPDAVEEQVKAEGFDESVEVLSLAFPEVLGQMAEHIEWTETVGTAMLAQSDDVLEAVQVMRSTAIDTGALVDTEQQVVTRDVATETVIIQPADPQVVYVPQYSPQVVYNNSLADTLVTGAVTFGTVALIAEIFDDNDDWDDYWGCRNCGGWNGGPIIRDPDIDIDVDGNVNFGNRFDFEGGDRVSIDRDKLNIDRDKLNFDRDRIENKMGWRPDPDRMGEARDRIADRRGEGGVTKLPLKRPSDGDALRDRLNAQIGTRDRDRGPGQTREFDRDRLSAQMRDIARDRDRGPGQTREFDRDRLSAQTRDIARDRDRGPGQTREFDRDRLSAQMRDIARNRDRDSMAGAAANRPAVKRPAAGGAFADRAVRNREANNGARGDGRELLRERSTSRAALSRPQEVKRPNVSRYAASNNKNRQTPQIARGSSGSRAKAASHRGGGGGARANWKR